MPNFVASRALIVAHRDVGVGAVGQAGMQRRHVLRAVERPDMHVVDFAHAGDIGDDVAGDAVAVELGRHAFEQHMGGLAHQRPGASTG